MHNRPLSAVDPSGYSLIEEVMVNGNAAGDYSGISASISGLMSAGGSGGDSSDDFNFTFGDMADWIVVDNLLLNPAVLEAGFSPRQLLPAAKSKATQRRTRGGRRQDGVPIVCEGGDGTCSSTKGGVTVSAQKSSPLPPVSALVGAGSTGADLAAGLMYCISGGGSCPGSKTFKTLQSDPTWVSNTAPMRFVAKAAFFTSIGVEAYEFNQARNNSDGLGMLDAIIDSGAMLPALVGGAYGAAFSTGYAVGDNLLGPLLVPPIVNGACSLTGNC